MAHLTEIDVNELRNAISACKNSLDCNNSNNIMNEISENILYSNNRKRIKNALEKIDNKHNEINQFLDNCNLIANKIEAYQELYATNVSLKERYDEIKDNLYYEEEYEDEEYNEETKKMETVTKTRKVKDEEVAKEMDTNKTTRKENKEAMSEISSEIESMVDNI